MVSRSLVIALGCVLVAGLGCDSQRRLTPPIDGSAKTQSPPTTPERRRPAINSLAFSPDGATFVTGTQNGLVTFVDPTSGASGASLAADPGAITRVAFSNDGRILASASANRVHLVDAKSRAEMGSFEHFDGKVTSVALSKDDRVAVGLKLVEVTELEDVGADGKRVHKRPAGPFGRLVVYDRNTKREVLRKDFGAAITDLGFSPDGSVLALGTAEGTVLLADPSTADIRSTLSGLANVERLVFSKDGSSLFAAGSIVVCGWKTTGAELFRHIEPGNNYLWLDVSPDGTVVAVASSFGRAIELLRASTGEVVSKIPEPVMPLSVAFSRDGSTLAVGDDEGNLRFVDAKTGKAR